MAVDTKVAEEIGKYILETAADRLAIPESTERKNFPPKTRAFQAGMILAGKVPMAFQAVSEVIDVQGDDEAMKVFNRLDDMNIREWQLAYLFTERCKGIVDDLVSMVMARDTFMLEELNLASSMGLSMWWSNTQGGTKQRFTVEQSLKNKVAVTEAEKTTVVKTAPAVLPKQTVGKTQTASKDAQYSPPAAKGAEKYPTPVSKIDGNGEYQATPRPGTPREITDRLISGRRSIAGTAPGTKPIVRAMDDDDSDYPVRNVDED